MRADLGASLESPVLRLIMHAKTWRNGVAATDDAAYEALASAVNEAIDEADDRGASHLKGLLDEVDRRRELAVGRERQPVRQAPSGMI